jgi:hypothetical protein
MQKPSYYPQSVPGGFLPPPDMKYVVYVSEDANQRGWYTEMSVGYPSPSTPFWRTPTEVDEWIAYRGGSGWWATYGYDMTNRQPTGWIYGRYENGKRL